MLRKCLEMTREAAGEGRRPQQDGYLNVCCLGRLGEIWG
jgi:hypothetical protein